MRMLYIIIAEVLFWVSEVIKKKGVYNRLVHEWYGIYTVGGPCGAAYVPTGATFGLYGSGCGNLVCAGAGSCIVSVVLGKVEPEAIVLVSGWSSSAAVLGTSNLRRKRRRRQRAIPMQ